MIVPLFCLAFTLCQQSHAGHGVPSIPQELLERPIGLQAGIGSAHDAIATTSKRAQAYYDQAITYLHSYAWIDAARSFHAALRADPDLAIAYAGLSVAYEEANKTSAARAAIERAQSLAAAASPHDRAHIELRAKQVGGDLPAFRAALDAALAAFPADVELLLLRGVAEGPDAADRGQGSTDVSKPFYTRALALAPDHFAAHHYLVHAHENTGRIDAALAHARHYARLAPAIPHAHHMLGHHLRRVGRIADAIASFQRAYELEISSERAAEVPPEYDWHHQHNLDLLATSYQYVGQMRTAERFMHRSFAMPTPLVVQAFNKHEWPAFLLARGRADEALAAAQTLTQTPAAVVRGIGRIMAGRALLALGRAADAAAASNKALSELRNAGPEASLAAPHLQALQAEIHLRTGDRVKALASFRDVRRRIRAMPGPDAWSQGLFRLESIGRAAVAAGAWDLAAETAADMREHDPSYGGTHHLAALVAEQRGNADDAGQHLERAERAWRGADADFANLIDVRRRLARRR